MYDVVIPLYNKADTIERCLTSVASQTVPVRQVIVVNDGSTDGSDAVVESICQTLDLDLRVVNQDNQGVSAARNRGVFESTSEIVCLLDADDAWHADYIANMQMLISDCPDANLYCSGHLLSEDGAIVKPKHGCPEGFRGYIDNFFVSSAKGSVANSSKVAIRRQSLTEVGGFPVGVRAGEDLYVWIKLAIIGKVACDPTPLVTVYRETDHKRDSRQENIPYPLKYFAEDKVLLRQTEGLSSYLVRIGVFHVAGSSMEGNMRSGLKRARAVFRLSPAWGLISLAILLTPSALLTLVKRIRAL